VIFCSGHCEHGKFMGECFDCVRGEAEEYGGEVEVVQWESETMEGWRISHTGDPLHDTVPIGEECQCGWINFGVQP
jgi:hypothetical protein